MPPTHSSFVSRIRDSRTLDRLPWLVLATTLGLALLLAQREQRANEREVEEGLKQHVREVAERIDDRMAAYEQVLRGTVGLFASSDTVSRREFRDYVGALRLGDDYRGIQAVGFAKRIAAEEKDRHVAAVRAEGFVDYFIRPTGERPAYSPVVFIEPFSGRNLRVFGFDLLSETKRRECAEQARDAGRAKLTGKVTLQQETREDVQPGAIMLMPVYRGSIVPDTVEARRAAIAGWVFGTFRMGDLMSGILGDDDGQIAIELFDGPAMTPETRLFRSHPGPPGSGPEAGRLEVLPLTVGGRTWSLAVTSRPGLEGSYASGRVALVAAAGGLTSLLLTALTWSLVRARRRAIESADAIRRSEARFRSTFHLPLVGLAITSPQMGWLEVNDQLCELLGYSRDEMADLTWGLLTHPDDLAADLAQLRRVLAGEIDSYSLEKRFLRKGGGILWSLVSVGCVRRADGSVDFMVGLLKDISKRKAIEEELQRERDLLREAEAIGQVGSIEWDVATGRWTVSDEFRNIYGFSPGEPIRTGHLLALVHPDDKSRVDKAFRDYLAGSEQNEVEHRIVRRSDGVVRCVHARGLAIRDVAGHPVRVVGVSQDITERKRAEEEVHELNRELESRVATRTAELRSALEEMESFSYSVAHDLRAPVRAIDGYAGLLEEQVAALGDEEAQRLLGSLRSSSRRMGRLIDDLLNFSRTGRLELHLGRVEMTELALRVAAESLPASGGERYEIRVAELPPAQADARLIEVVLRNLVANAFKFASPRERPVIEIGSREADGVVEYFVRDNGVGFDPRYAHKLFGVFQRLHAADEFEGTGIGLALVGKIVGRHGGRVRAEGELDRGATFAFTLRGS